MSFGDVLQCVGKYTDQLSDGVARTVVSHGAPQAIKTGVSYITTVSLIILSPAVLAMTTAATYPLVSLAMTVCVMRNALDLASMCIGYMLTDRCDAFTEEKISHITRLLLTASIALATPAYPIICLAATISSIESAILFPFVLMTKEVKGSENEQEAIEENNKRIYAAITLCVFPIMAVAVLSPSVPFMPSLATRAIVLGYASECSAMLIAAGFEEESIQMKVTHIANLAILGFSAWYFNPAIAVPAAKRFATDIPYTAQMLIFNTNQSAQAS